jgi:D-cysteine desulfhydrase
MQSLGLPRVPLAALPTPLDPLPRLGEALGGMDLWLKRDDLTGLAFGGNKTRKLELLLAAAQAAGADTLVTCGAPQSNHCRQTAAAAARLGLACTLVLRGGPPPHINGNVLLDQLLGARLIWTGERPLAETQDAAIDHLRAAGRKPYPIPYGGSSPLGAAAYAAALQELLAQGPPPDWIVLATSSGGTQAGLLAGAAWLGYAGSILGISVDRSSAEIRPAILALAEETAGLLPASRGLRLDEVLVQDDYLGQGYAVLSPVEQDAIHLFARLEGVFLDPVYTGRAAGGLMDQARRGRFQPNQRVVFWHTGGTPALFAYAEALSQEV